MSILILHVPENPTHGGAKKSLSTTISTGVASGFILSLSERMAAQAGCKVDLVCKKTQRYYVGVSTGVKPAGVAGNGKLRYDISLKNINPAPYTPVKFNHNGVYVMV